MDRRIVFIVLVIGAILVVLAGLALIVGGDDDTLNNEQTANVNSGGVPDDEFHAGVSTLTPEGADPVNDFVALGLTYAEQGRIDEAIQAFEIALAAAEGREKATPNYYLGNIHLILGDIEQAVLYLEAASHADSTLPKVWTTLGSAYSSAGRPMSAIEAFNEALALSPDDAVTLTNRGQAFMRIDARDQALVDFNQAIELDPTLVAAYFNRGTTYFLSGDAQAAVADFTQVLDLDAAQGQAHFNRAIVYVELGEKEAAVADLEMFLAFNPSDDLRAEAQTVLDDLLGRTENDGEDE